MSSPSLSNLPRLETLADAAGYLDGLINRERIPDYAYRRLDLRPIHALLDGLGRPEQTLSVIHVAGSKGKGSTCLFAESILLELGESVGTFTSPHLESWVERFRIEGRPVDEARLVDAVARVRPHVEALRAGPRETWPSFFDATTAIAFLLFAEAGVGRALIEVGLGGRLDSTNVVSPRVTCITSIELEHTDKLGPTEAAIAGEKAGILKPGIVAILGPLRPEARAVIRARAETVGAPVREWGEAFEGAESSRSACGLRYVEPGGFELEVELAMPGAPARTNAALAIACVRALDVWSDEALSQAARAALSGARLPARMERLPHDPAVLIDSAHTARSARALADALATLAPKGFDLLLSVSSDKDLRALLQPLLPSARRIWTTCADRDRSLPADELAARIRELVGPAREVTAIADPIEAIGAARAGLPSDATDRPRPEPGAIVGAPTGPQMLCVTGSIYLAGLARRALSREGLASSEESVKPATKSAPPSRPAFEPPRAGFSRQSVELLVEPARAGDIEHLPGIELRAATLFSPEDLPRALAAEATPVETFRAAQRRARLWVARAETGLPVGFALLEVRGRDACLDELDVDPAYGRRGLGRRLIEAVRDVARERGHRRLVLATFRDVPWNAPFYRRLGFTVVGETELDPGLEALRRKDAETGLDLARRVVMTLDL